MLDAIEQRREPRQRVFLNHVDRLETQLSQSPVSDIADVLFDFLGAHAGHGTLFKCQVDERILKPNGFLTYVHNVVAHRLCQAVAFRAKCVEQLDDPLAVQAFVADRPRHDLSHALHLVEPREIHQHCKAREQLKSLGKPAEHRQRAGDILITVHIERRKIVVLVLHFFILKEHAVFAFGHADGVEQMRVCCDMHRLHVGKRGEHHLDFGRLEHPAVMLMITILHLDIGLSKKAKNLRQQIALMVGELLRPVAAVFAERHFLRHPVDLLLALPKFVRPGIFKGLILVAGFGKGHGSGSGRNRVQKTVRRKQAQLAASKLWSVQA